MTLDPKLVEAVKKFEGFEPTAKWDFKQWTNGYGTRTLVPHETISREQAEERLHTELGHAVDLVAKFAPGAPQGAQDALASLSYNAGTEWMHEELGAAVKAGDWATAKAHFLMYDRAGGAVREDLVKRRQTEASWFPGATVDPVPPPAPAQHWDPTMGTPEPSPQESLLQRAIHKLEEAL